VLDASTAWKEAHGLPQPPLSFEGLDGTILKAQQLVGVIEAGGVCVEIYPKLDAELVKDEQVTDQRAATVMKNLIWLLEESAHEGLIDSGDAEVEESPDSICDLLAWLFARRLRHQLGIGLAQEYIGMRDDLPLVRGRIDFARQSTVHFGRPDVIACTWDEFTPDTPLARLLRCATEVLLERVRLPGAAGDLREALAMFDEVESVPPIQAVASAPSIRWSRLNMRWRACHDLALAVLTGQGREMHAGSSGSFVFLIDMNRLFEDFCLRWLEKTFDRNIEPQKYLGTLLVGPDKRIAQNADFFWQTPDVTWVGDAKYKLPDAQNWPRIDDLRQLICYGQLAQRLYKGRTSRLMILHPTIGEEKEPESMQTYDGQMLQIQGVRVIRTPN
jgi:5-methylcytosine-specific restriction enzyme subunit McrC